MGTGPRWRRKEGDLPLFPDLYREHVRLVRNVLFRLVGGAHLDDLTQETFLKIWRGLGSFRGDSSLKTWIYSIATRTALDHVRRHGSRMETSDGDLPHLSLVDEEKGHLYRDLVRRGLEALSFEHRSVLVLHVLEGLSLQEISTITEAPLGTLKSRLHFARKQLLAFFEKEGVNL